MNSLVPNLPQQLYWSAPWSSLPAVWEVAVSLPMRSASSSSPTETYNLPPLGELSEVQSGGCGEVEVDHAVGSRRNIMLNGPPVFDGTRDAHGPLISFLSDGDGYAFDFITRSGVALNIASAAVDRCVGKLGQNADDELHAIRDARRRRTGADPEWV